MKTFLTLSTLPVVAFGLTPEFTHNYCKALTGLSGSTCVGSVCIWERVVSEFDCSDDVINKAGEIYKSSLNNLNRDNYGITLNMKRSGT